MPRLWGAVSHRTERKNRVPQHRRGTYNLAAVRGLLNSSWSRDFFNGPASGLRLNGQSGGMERGGMLAGSTIRVDGDLSFSWSVGNATDTQLLDDLESGLNVRGSALVASFFSGI